MRIGILVLAAGRQAGGIETYEIELLHALASIDTVNQYVVYCPDERARRAISLQQDNFTFYLLRPSWRAISLSVSLPWLLKKHAIDVFHATYAPPPFPPRKMVFTCHGLATFLFPQSFDTLTRWRLHALHRMALSRAECILCVSRHTLDSLKHSKRISPERLALAVHGVADIFCPGSRAAAQSVLADELGIHHPFVLYVGKIQEIKNIARLIEAFKKFRAATGSKVSLVLAGRVLQEPEALRDRSEEDGIIVLGHIDSTKLPHLYRAAEMLVLPSLFESFGLPIIEAMRCGTPVIASNVGAIPEVCGEAAYLIDPYSTCAMAEAMIEVFRNADLRQSMIERGISHASGHSWRRTAEATLDAYRHVHRRANRNAAHHA